MNNPIRKIFDQAEGFFQKGKPLAPFKPIYDATDTFFFHVGDTTAKAPFMRDGVDLKRFMMTVIVALTPAILAAIWFNGPYVLSMIAVSYICGGTIEVAFAIVRKEEINEGFLVSGMLLPLIMPVTAPLWVVGVAMAFGVLFGKEVFGGTGNNPVNPALVGRCFVFLSWPNHTSPAEWRTPLAFGEQFNPELWLNWRHWIFPESYVDATTMATPLNLVKSGDLDQLPTAWNMFIGNIPGSVGETSTILIILGGLYLLWTRVANFRPIVGALLGTLVLGQIFNWINPELNPPGYYGLIAGGTMFLAFFMTTDPVSSPITNPARWTYGIMIGIGIGLGRQFGGFPGWLTFAVLLCNLCAPLLDEAVWAYRFRKLAPGLSAPRGGGVRPL
jgi:Na+-transporting NADH:ubiquinone oxidoreductase subunit B